MLFLLHYRANCVSLSCKMLRLALHYYFKHYLYLTISFLMIMYAQPIYVNMFLATNRKVSTVRARTNYTLWIRVLTGSLVLFSFDLTGLR